MKFRRITAAALIAVTALSQTAFAAEFEDTKGHWAEEAISALAERNIVSGVSEKKFNPDGEVTRAEFLRMIMNTCGVEANEYRNGECLDTLKNAWYAEYVQGALDRGLIPSAMIEDYGVSIVYSDNGEPRALYKGKFTPEAPITREEIAALTQTFYQYWTNIETMQETDHSDEIDFIDLGSASKWALPYIRLAYAQGFISGMGNGNLRPLAKATRAQAAIVINNVLNKMK